jgi:O-antigen ligase
MSELALFPAESRSRGISRPVLFISACAVTLLSLVVLSTHPTYLLFAAGAIVAAAVAIYGITYSLRHNEWLVFALALLFLLIQISFLNESARAGLHYFILAILALPVLSKVLRSGILGTGGFRLYLVFFAWSAITITYSLAPLYSLARLSEAVLVMIAVAACVLEIREPDDVTRLLFRFALACAVIVALLAVGTAVLPHRITWASPLESYTRDQLIQMSKSGIAVGGLDRFRGLLNGPNDVGGLMLVAVGAALACWRAVARRERLLLAAMIIAAVAFDVLADSRSAFVAISVGGGFFAIWKWRLRGALLCAGVLAAAAGVMFHAGFFAYAGRGDVSTLTGRTDIWDFVIRKIRERPIIGYGYETSGALFDSRYFPLWWGPWDLGPHSSLHNGYLGHAAGVGIPATVLWLYIIIRPWIFALRQKEDPWNLKPMFFLIVIPILINNFSEQYLGDFGGGLAALLFGVVWTVAERHRLIVLAQMESERVAALARLPKAVGAVASAGYASRAWEPETDASL